MFRSDEDEEVFQSGPDFSSLFLDCSSKREKWRGSDIIWIDILTNSKALRSPFFLIRTEPNMLILFVSSLSKYHF
jgi:hypothetical protein